MCLNQNFDFSQLAVWLVCKSTSPIRLVLFTCCRPPALCGAVSAEPNYIAKTGDKVAARVRSTDGEENWILAEVVSYNSSSCRYEVDDIDAEEGKE